MAAIIGIESEKPLSHLKRLVKYLFESAGTELKAAHRVSLFGLLAPVTSQLELLLMNPDGQQSSGSVSSAFSIVPSASEQLPDKRVKQ